jgi:hypothetical protein
VKSQFGLLTWETAVPSSATRELVVDGGAD